AAARRLRPAPAPAAIDSRERGGGADPRAYQAGIRQGARARNAVAVHQPTDRCAPARTRAGQFPRVRGRARHRAQARALGHPATRGRAEIRHGAHPRRAADAGHQRLLESPRAQLDAGPLRRGRRSRGPCARHARHPVWRTQSVRTRHGAGHCEARDGPADRPGGPRHAAAVAGAAGARDGIGDTRLRSRPHGDDGRYARHRTLCRHQPRAQRAIPLAPLVRGSLRRGRAPVPEPTRRVPAVDEEDRAARRDGIDPRRGRYRETGRAVSLGTRGATAMKDILVPISPGELLDKITILRIKAARMTDATKVANVKHELGLLEQTWQESGAAAVDLGGDEAELTRVNEMLWVI